jgi:hypothetical protein
MPDVCQPPDAIKSRGYENLVFPFQRLRDTIMANISDEQH